MMSSMKHGLSVLLAVLLLACGTEPGSVSIRFTWDGKEPGETVWIFGRVIQVAAESGTTGQIVAETDAPQEYEPGMSLTFPDVQNRDNLSVLLEARGDSSMESRVLYYGISESFSLSAGENVEVDVSVAMAETPEISNLAVQEAVGPADCPDCYSSTETVTLQFGAVRAKTVEIANDNEVSVCKHTFQVEEDGEEPPRLITGDDVCHVEGWNLNCGLEETGDGPRNVYVRTLDAEGYPSQTLSIKVVLDRQPPTEGTLACAEGGWLIELRTTMLFGVVKGDEMWVEACESGAAPADGCETMEGGLDACDPDHEHHIAVNTWTDFTTEGCVHLKDDSVKNLRVKYRDFAHNETDWVEFEFDSVTDLQLVWVPIPGGTFDMGCSPGDTECQDDEYPVHAVTLSPFEMLETEVTERQYFAVTGKSPSYQELGENYPVERVTWFEAKLFCDKVGGRLPTEAEWEYAARAGTTTRYYCGEDMGCLDEIAWSVYNSDNVKHEVGGMKPNDYGLHDMLGNVFEWTADRYGANYYATFPDKNPQGPDNGTSRVVRGGSYYAWMETDPHYLRVSNRFSMKPSVTTTDVGIRCCRFWHSLL